MSLRLTGPSQAGRRCGFTLGEEKTDCGLDHGLDHEWPAAAGNSEGEASGGFPWDGHQCHQGLDPLRFPVPWALLAVSKEKSLTSYSSFQAESESSSPVGAQGEGNQTGDSHL